MTDPTPAERRTLAVIRAHWRAHGHGPTVRDVQRACGYRSPQSVRDLFARMALKGLIETEPREARAVWVAGDRELVKGVFA